MLPYVRERKQFGKPIGEFQVGMARSQCRLTCARSSDQLPLRLAASLLTSLAGATRALPTRACWVHVSILSCLLQGRAIIYCISPWHG